jgi:hypothetical protein
MSAMCGVARCAAGRPCAALQKRWLRLNRRATHLPAWAALTAEARATLLAALADALAGYAEHFAGLIAEETGKDAVAAAAEVSAALQVLRTATAGAVATGGGRVVAVVSDDRAPLLGPLQQAAYLSGAAGGRHAGPQAKPQGPLRGLRSG